MGLCMSASTESMLIDAKMVQEQRTDADTTKLLLLGTGNSGKSTFFRQFQLLSGHEFTSKDRESHRAQIYTQIISSMVFVAKVVQKNYQLKESGELGNHINQLINNFADKDTIEKLDKTSCELIRYLWNREEIKQTFDGMSRIRPIPESSEFFWNDLDRVSKEDYVPTNEDIILSRAPTTGAYNFKFTRGEAMFELVDVGGQRCERKKWLSHFDNVTTLLYVISLSAWDEVLYEDVSTNAMADQIEQFQKIVNLEVFQDTPIVLFMNKQDLLEKRLKEGRSIADFFGDYDGPNEFEPSVEYIRHLFVSKNENPFRKISVYTTHATDSASVRVVLANVTQTIISNMMHDVGLI